jgi:hypothetical protein
VRFSRLDIVFVLELIIVLIIWLFYGLLGNDLLLIVVGFPLTMIVVMVLTFILAPASLKDK